MFYWEHPNQQLEDLFGGGVDIVRVPARILPTGQPFELGDGFFGALEMKQQLGPLLADFEIIGQHGQSLGQDDCSCVGLAGGQVTSIR